LGNTPGNLWEAKSISCNTAGEKCQKKLNELGHKCKEVMANLSAQPFLGTKGIRPRRPKIIIVVEPWWNLVAAQDGSAPENHRVRKQFCPEAFTMAEDPKAIAVGKKLPPFKDEVPGSSVVTWKVSFFWREKTMNHGKTEAKM